MTTQEIIYEYNNRLHAVYKQENLTCLKSILREGTENKKTPVFFEIIEKNKSEFRSQFNYLKNYDNLLTRSDEILHYTGLLFLHRPYINNPIDEAFYTDEGIIYPNNQNLEAKRYYMYADTASEKVYNYWERIGDLLASFFPDIYSKNEMKYFSKTIDKIPKTFHNSRYFLWLKEFKQNQYKELNSHYRKSVVHQDSTDTNDRLNHAFIATQEKEIQEWIQKRHELADFYKNQIELSIKGYHQTLYFLQEVGNSFSLNN